MRGPILPFLKLKPVECYGLRKDRFYIIKVKNKEFFYKYEHDMLEILSRNGIEGIIVLVENKDDLEICEAKKKCGR